MRLKIAAKMDYSNRAYCEELIEQMKSPHVDDTPLVVHVLRAMQRNPRCEIEVSMG